MKRAIIIVIDDMPNATWSQELNRMMKYTIEYEDGNLLLIELYVTCYKYKKRTIEINSSIEVLNILN